MEILNPVSPRRTSAIEPAPRIPGMRGHLVGLLYNGKPGGVEILEGIRKELAARFDGVETERRNKRHAASGAPFLHALMGRWRAAVVAVGD
ncbi:MAG TPA: hypothetical protein VNJ51_06460 [Candidatus Dormibacteraeota bacterium]|nr:hypothetical protein [Candidatus Dormibacteraeota bacterium]